MHGFKPSDEDNDTDPAISFSSLNRLNTFESLLETKASSPTNPRQQFFPKSPNFTKSNSELCQSDFHNLRASPTLDLGQNILSTPRGQLVLSEDLDMPLPLNLDLNVPQNATNSETSFSERNTYGSESPLEGFMRPKDLDLPYTIDGVYPDQSSQYEQKVRSRSNSRQGIRKSDEIHQISGQSLFQEQTPVQDESQSNPIKTVFSALTSFLPTTLSGVDSEDHNEKKSKRKGSSPTKSKKKKKKAVTKKKDTSSSTSSKIDLTRNPIAAREAMEAVRVASEKLYKEQEMPEGDNQAAQKVRRRIRNCISAKLHRERRRVYVESLERQIEELTAKLSKFNAEPQMNGIQEMETEEDGSNESGSDTTDLSTSSSTVNLSMMDKFAEKQTKKRKRRSSFAAGNLKRVGLGAVLGAAAMIGVMSTGHTQTGDIFQKGNGQPSMGESAGAEAAPRLLLSSPVRGNHVRRDDDEDDEDSKESKQKYASAVVVHQEKEDVVHNLRGARSFSPTFVNPPSCVLTTCCVSPQSDKNKNALNVWMPSDFLPQQHQMDVKESQWFQLGCDMPHTPNHQAIISTLQIDNQTDKI